LSAGYQLPVASCHGDYGQSGNSATGNRQPATGNRQLENRQLITDNQQCGPYE
jgi:hypothetical protein